ncbi:MAG: SdiA-regulated domain-containing protein, partial [Chloroflexota bacterium]|nr:SdiA-regulated domain-containing protein [Chloroflexota bacterium]
MVETARTLYPKRWGMQALAGLTYAAELNQFFLLEKTSATLAHASKTRMVVVTPYEEVIAAANLNFSAEDTLHIAFDDNADRLFFLNFARNDLVQLTVNPDSSLNVATETHVNIAHFALQSVTGMAVDRQHNTLVILDSDAAQVVRVPLTADLSNAAVTKLPLPPELGTDLHSLAVNPATHELYVLSPAAQMLYELTPSGRLKRRIDLAGLNLANPHGLAVAPSADLTDDPQTLHLLVADGQPIAGQSAKIVEFALDAPPTWVNAASVDLTPLTLVQTVDTSTFSPPSPDPSGITYIPATDIFLISDAEVNEIPALYTGVNVFAVASNNELAYTLTTAPFSEEPAGIAYNPNNGHIFYADDNKNRVYEVNPGADGTQGTADDIRTSFSTAVFDAMDPEGLDYDPNSGDLFIADGSNHEIYRLDPGANGLFDGVLAGGGDDNLTSFDTAVHGILNPDGVAFDPATGNLLLTGRSKLKIYELTAAGELVEIFDISAAQALVLGGIEIAPGSVDPAVMNYYIVDRGVDNFNNPDQNDGKLYEFAAPLVTPVATATATATPVTPAPTATATSTPV